MNPRTLTALAAVLAFLIKTTAGRVIALTTLLTMAPRLTFHAGPVPVSVPTGVLIIAAEVLAAAVLIRLAWKACGGFWLRPRMTEAAS